MRSRHSSVPEAWAKCIARAIRAWNATSRSRSQPPVFTTNPDRLARFERELRLLAALNHPNIATIHGLEEAGDASARAIVMELVEGETLAGRLGRHPNGLSVTEAGAIAQQIVGALAAAHDKGIIHRDLKPANIMITTCRWRGESPGLRPGEDGQGRRRTDVAGSHRHVRGHSPGRRARNCRVHEPGTGAGKSRRRPLGRVLVRCRVLYEMMTGQRAVSRRDDGRDAGEGARIAPGRCENAAARARPRRLRPSWSTASTRIASGVPRRQRFRRGLRASRPPVLRLPPVRGSAALCSCRCRPQQSRRSWRRAYGGAGGRERTERRAAAYRN